MLNSITIHGRLTQDVELKQTSSGVDVCSFTVAVDRSFTKGEDKITDFFTVVCWRGLAEIVSKYFTKGKEIIVSGKMQSRKWQDNNGNARVSWEIQADSVDFCGSKGNYTPETENATEGVISASKGANFEELPEDSDLPF